MEILNLDAIFDLIQQGRIQGAELKGGTLRIGESQSIKLKCPGGYHYDIAVVSKNFSGILPVYDDKSDFPVYEFCFEIYTEDGVKSTDNGGNSGPKCHFNISPGSPLLLTLVVSRVTIDQNKYLDPAERKIFQLIQQNSPDTLPSPDEVEYKFNILYNDEGITLY